jgi:UDP-N-acetylglucosamine--N-acetylmuramyl-(pentapeptide) pyrophosphoryl-undecaprenol N-acetylglucosamine transferase
MTTPRPTFVFAGGGTGGHIYPALAVARALRDLTPDPVVRFLVSQRPLDAAILTRELPPGGPWSFAPIPAQPFSTRPAGFYRFVTRWGEAVRAARAELRAAKQQGPVVLGAFGGFVAAPAAQAARVERVPALLVNLDAVPGKANRWIAGRVRRVLTASRLAPGCERPGWEVIPPIVRPEALAPEPPARCRASFDLDPDRPTLLVTGGSQGAGSINALLAALAALPESPLRAWQVIHQTGAKAADAARSAYERAGVRAWVGEFIESMGRAWGAADLAICRAGAGNVAEAWANRVPCVFLPYPHHRDQHQAHNARALADAGGAVIAPDAIDPQANLQRHADTLRALLTDHARLGAMHNALGALGPADGAAQAARALAALVNPT